MLKRIKIIPIITCSIFLLSCLPSNPKCALFRNGRFHVYTKIPQNHFIIIRKDSLQTEIDLKSGDTSYWKIGWISDCEFNCDYISATITKSKKDESFYKNSTIKFSIIKTSKEYYVFEALFSSALLTKKYSDTVWLHEK